MLGMTGGPAWAARVVDMETDWKRVFPFE